MSIDLPEYRDEEHNRQARKAAVADEIKHCQSFRDGKRCQLPFAHERSHIYEIKGITGTPRGAPRMTGS